jgi:hypothetical protein
MSDANAPPPRERSEERREGATALMVVGWVIVAFDFLILFFFPASIRVGRHRSFLWTMGLLGALGLVLIVTGYVKRRRLP